jgi:hypothetical protein
VDNSRDMTQKFGFLHARFLEVLHYNHLESHRLSRRTHLLYFQIIVLYIYWTSSYEALLLMCTSKTLRKRTHVV